jgi:hypothetical protein
MSDLVYFNEPGLEKQINTTDGKHKNVGYSNIVKYGNIIHAMQKQIQNPPKEFEEIILRHFYLKRTQIMKEVNSWLETVNETANYTGMVKSQNYSLCTLLEGSKYGKCLKEEIKRLGVILEKLTIEKITSGVISMGRINVNSDEYYKKLD